MAPVNYAIYGMDEPVGASSFNEIQTQYATFDSKPNDMHVPRANHLDATSIDQQLKQYESYLDDYSRFRRGKLRCIAMSKYSQIMQSIKSKSRDRFQFEYDEDDDSDDEDELYIDGHFQSIRNGRFPDSNEHRQPAFNFRPTMGPSRNQRTRGYPDWNKIIRRHRTRVRANQYASEHAFTWGTIAPSNTEQ